MTHHHHEVQGEHDEVECPRCGEVVAKVEDFIHLKDARLDAGLMQQENRETAKKTFVPMVVLNAQVQIFNAQETNGKVVNSGTISIDLAQAISLFGQWSDAIEKGLDLMETEGVEPAEKKRIEKALIAAEITAAVQARRAAGKN